MVVPDCELGENGMFVFADCAINDDPDSEALAQINERGYADKYIRKREEQKTGDAIKSLYEQGEPKEDYQPYVISMFCGNAPSGGLVDRLRGAVSTYQECVATGRSFKLHFTHPFLLSDYLVPLYLGPGFERSAALLKIFSLLIIVVGLNNAVGKQVLMPVGRQKEYNMSVILGAIVNFALNFLLIPRLFSVGAVIASVAAETSILLAFIFYSRDYIRLSWIVKASVKYLAGGLAMAALIRLSYIWLGLSWKSLAIQVAGGGIIYVIVVLLLRDRFALEVLGIFLRHTPFGKKRT